jgi:putative spermidine/putrescine transport system permease protein
MAGRRHGAGGRALVTAAAALVLAFLLLPVLIIAIYAFSDSNVQVWPIARFSLDAFSEAFANQEIRAAFGLSLWVAAIATAIAVALGSVLAFVIDRYSFFGRDVVSFAVVLPIALPGIVTGIALNSFFGFAGLGLSALTIVIAHSTFCIVIVYNNVLARFRRLPRSFVEASMDLGADSLVTFRKVTFPMIGSAIVAGALLAFALSFDEVIVTTFTAGVQTTLPLWVFGAIRLGQHLNQVNVVVLGVVVITALPVFLSQRLMGDVGSLHK